MANNSSAKKFIKKSAAKTKINKGNKTRIKTFIKKVFLAMEEGNKEQISIALIRAQSEIMSAVNSNVLKKNTASRKVKQLFRQTKDKISKLSN